MARRAVASPLPEGMIAPGHSHGLFDVFRWRFLLTLLVRKELRVRYRGSVLGLLWSYVKPAAQLAVFYVAMGKFLQLSDRMPNFVIYLFSGIVIVNFFTEVFYNTTRSIVMNSDLVKKIYMPRELFPVSSLWVAMVHLLPQLIVLIIAAVATGWRPGGLNLLAILAGLLITGVTALGLGLLFGAVNVLFRDAENLVDLVLMMATWLSPVLYTWELVRRAVPDPLWIAYQVNPITPSVELFHYGFWLPTAATRDLAVQGDLLVVPPDFPMWVAVAAAVSVALVTFGQFVFHRLEGRFAQEL